MGDLREEKRVLMGGKKGCWKIQRKEIPAPTQDAEGFVF
jgi:hypothetical protein